MRIVWVRRRERTVSLQGCVDAPEARLRAAKRVITQLTTSTRESWRFVRFTARAEDVLRYRVPRRPLGIKRRVLVGADSGRVKELLAETARRSRGEAGCMRFEVYHSQADRRSFLLVERWDDQGHLDAHRLGSTFREFYTPNVLPLVERAPHPSDLVAVD